jgi:hypothetical protein
VCVCVYSNYLEKAFKPCICNIIFSSTSTQAKETKEKNHCKNRTVKVGR